MRIVERFLGGAALLEPRLFRDERGFFLEAWNERTLTALGLAHSFVQDNHSGSISRTLRGLHYQWAVPQGKLVRVVAGTVLDVAVDLRPGSSTFGRWSAWELDAASHRQLWIPPGFAHGFLVQSDWAEVLYKCTAPYDPMSEVTIRWDDPTLAIDWRLPPGIEPLLSAKDRAGVSLADAPAPAFPRVSA